MKRLLVIFTIFIVLFGSIAPTMAYTKATGAVGVVSPRTYTVANQTVNNYSIQFDSKNMNHLLANLVVLSQLQDKWFNIDRIYDSINNWYKNKLDTVIAWLKRRIGDKSFKEQLEEIADIIWWDRTDPGWLLDWFWVNIDMNWDRDDTDYGSLDGALSAWQRNWAGWIPDMWWSRGNFGWRGNDMAWWDTWDVSASHSSRKHSQNGSATTSVSQESYQTNWEWETRYSFKHATIWGDWTVNGNSYTRHEHADGTSETSTSTWTKNSDGTATRTTTYRKYDSDWNEVEKKEKTTKTWMQDPDAPWNEWETGAGTPPSAAMVAFLQKINPNYTPFAWQWGWDAGDPGNNPNEDKWDTGNGGITVVWGDTVTNWWIYGKPINHWWKVSPTRIIRWNLDPVRDTGKWVKSDIVTMWFTWWPVGLGMVTSSDEYVNTKLWEINQCFLDSYNWHLENINKTIESFIDSKEKTNDRNSKNKYQEAIIKLQEIKSLFMINYGFILQYNAQQ